MLCQGCKLAKKTQSDSATPIDQAHEQKNALVKGSGGAAGLTQITSASRKWSGPEQERLVEESDNQFLKIRVTSIMMMKDELAQEGT